MATPADLDCFGFYQDAPVCQGCVPWKRCKAVLVSNGWSIAAAALETMVAELPDHNQYTDSDRIPVILNMVLSPKPVVEEKDDLLDLLQSKGISDTDVGAIL